MKGDFRDMGLFEEHGVSLVELMVAVTILSIGILAFVGTFTFITKSIHVSRARTLATNLAQEKVENLKNIPYYKLALTTSTQANNDFSPAIHYDVNNYGEETIRIGGITFKRGVMVSMAQEDDGLITSTAFDYPDSGLKAITVYVMWLDRGTWKYIFLDNIYENPYVDPLTAEITGAVKDESGDPIEGATVAILENTDWKDTVGADGSYAIQAQPGNYSVRAYASGYFDKIETNVDISSLAIVHQSFELVEIASGSVAGYAWVNDGLVWSHIVVSTRTFVGNGVGDVDIEFMQLFNPTTYAITIGTDTGNLIDINYYDEDGGGDNKSNDDFNFTYHSSFVPAGRYYLIANATFFWLSDRWTNADASYSGNYINPNEAGTLEIKVKAGGRVHDTVGWNDEDDTAPKFEGSPIPDTDKDFGEPDQCAGDGLGIGNSIVRVSSPASVNDTYGAAYDSGDNSVDWLYPEIYCLVISTPAIIGNTWNSLGNTMEIVAGKPAFGANVTSNDDLRPSTVAYRVTITEPFMTITLSHDLAYFRLDGVSTGTWSVVAASGAYSQTVSTVVVSQGEIAWLQNADSDPDWKVSTFHHVFLDSETTNGYLSGIVTDVSGAAIEGIIVQGGATTKTTGSNGRFFMSLSSGSTYVVANPNNADTTYVENIQQVTVETGEVQIVNFTLVEGGVLVGFITTDGTSVLPNVQVAATRGGVQYGIATSDASGNFYIRNLATGTYDVAPVLDPMETYTPLVITTAAAASQSLHIGTFTISGALGTLTGTIKIDGELLTSGALIVASTGAIGTPPDQIVASSSPAQVVKYSASSLADGTYTVEVRGSTSTTLNVSAFVPVIVGDSVTITTKTYSGVSVTANTATTLNITVP